MKYTAEDIAKIGTQPQKKQWTAEEVAKIGTQKPALSTSPKAATPITPSTILPGPQPKAKLTPILAPKTMPVPQTAGQLVPPRMIQQSAVARASDYLTQKPTLTLPSKTTALGALIPSPTATRPSAALSPAISPIDTRPTVGQFAGRNIMAGISTGINKPIAQTLDFLLPNVITPKIIQKGIEYYKDEGTRLGERAQQTNVQLGKPYEIGGQLIQGVVGAIPQAALAVATAGTSTAPQVAAQAPRAAKLLNAIGTSAKEFAKNPLFWTSFARTTGGTYEEAKTEGASELEAQATAIISGLINAGIEVGGGIEVLPKALRQGGTPAIRAWVKGMIDEGKEEVLQGMIENATKSVIYDKNRPFVSLGEESAVINPLRAAKEFGMGAAVGGILGGGQVLAGKALTPKAPQTITPLQPQPQITPQQAAEITQRFAPAQVQPAPVPQPQPVMQPAIQQEQEPLVPPPRTAPQIETKPVAAMASEILKDYSSKYGKSDLTNDITALYNDFAAGEDASGNELTYQDIKARAVDISKNILQNSSVRNDEAYQQYNDLIKYAKTTGLTVSQQDRGNFASEGGYNNFRKRNFGKIKLTNDGTPVDVAYAELSGVYGNTLFPETITHPAEQLIQIERVINGLKPVYENQYAGNIDEAADYLAEDIVERYYETPQQKPVGAIPQGLGAANLGFDPYSQAANIYGAIKPGETPARVVDIPAQTTPDTRTRQFARTMMESEAIPESMLSDFEREIVKGTFAYEPITDKAAVEYADKTIKYRGFEGAVSDWEAVTNGNKPANKNDIALGQTLLNQAANAGDAKLAMKLAAELAAEGTRSGQNVQALRLLKKMTPDGQLYYLQKSIQNLNNDLLDRLKSKAPNVQIDEALAAELLNAKNQQEIDAAVNKITQNIADQIPASWMDKWNAWRYLAMLGNPRTHIRNLVGNSIFVPAVKIKNRIAQGLEVLVPKEQRTKALTVDKSIRSFAEDDFKSIKSSVTGTGKYNPADLIRDRQTIFKIKPLEFARKFNLAALEAEDALFLKMHYVDSFSSAMKARGLTAEFLSNGTKTANMALENLRNYATQEAQKATYRDASELASMLNNTKRRLAQSESLGARAGGVLIEGVVPFTKTPINILKRGVEYSPIGLMDGLKSAMIDVKSGKVSASEAIDKIASGLTGTGIVALGMWLASMGLISGGSEDDRREQGFERLQGKQNYALKIGDTTYTLDWAAPASLPLFVGVEVFNITQGENPDRSISAILDSMTKLTEPMVEMSMLQGLNNTFKAVAYGDAPLSDVAIELASGYASQGVPTLAGQIARTMDTTRRTTYIDKTTGVPQFVQKFIQKQQAKIPGLSQELIPYIDQWGRTQETPSIAGRAMQNFLSPGYVSQINVTPVDKEIDRLYKKTGETSILPPFASKSITVDSDTVRFAADQYVNYATARGQKAFDSISGLISSKQYSKLSDDEKSDIIATLYKYSNALAKTKVSNYKMQRDMDKINKAESKGIPPHLYLIIKQSADINKNDSISQEEMQTALDRQNLTNAQKKYLFSLQNSAWKSNPYE